MSINHSIYTIYKSKKYIDTNIENTKSIKNTKCIQCINKWNKHIHVEKVGTLFFTLWTLKSYNSGTWNTKNKNER